MLSLTSWIIIKLFCFHYICFKFPNFESATIFAPISKWLLSPCWVECCDFCCFSSNYLAEHPWAPYIGHILNRVFSQGLHRVHIVFCMIICSARVCVLRQGTIITTLWREQNENIILSIYLAYNLIKRGYPTQGIQSSGRLYSPPPLCRLLIRENTEEGFSDTSFLHFWSPFTICRNTVVTFLQPPPHHYISGGHNVSHNAHHIPLQLQSVCW